LQVSPIRYWVYLVSSLVGMFPEQLLFVYIGNSVKDLAKIAAGEYEFEWPQAVMLVLGAVGIIGVTIVVLWIGRRALASARQMQLEQAAQAEGTELEVVESDDGSDPVAVITKSKSDDSLPIGSKATSGYVAVDGKDSYLYDDSDRDAAALPTASLNAIELDIPLPDVLPPDPTVGESFPDVNTSVSIDLDAPSTFVAASTDFFAPTQSLSSIPMPTFDDDLASSSSFTLPTTQVAPLSTTFLNVPPPPPNDDDNQQQQQQWNTSSLAPKSVDLSAVSWDSMLTPPPPIDDLF
jgi:hypothetical protein